MDACSGGRVTIAAFAAALVCALSAPVADGASVTAERRCYAEGDRIDLAGEGYTPLGHVELRLARAARPASALRESPEPIADTTGRVSGALAVEQDTGWFRSREERFRMQMRLSDMVRPAVTAATEFWFSRWNVGVTTRGGRLRPDRPAELRAVGFTGDAGRPLFAHWTRAGKRVKTLRLGALTGACGNLRRRLARGFPFRPVAPGTWHVAFNTSPRDPRARGTIVQRAARVRRLIP